MQLGVAHGIQAQQLSILLFIDIILTMQFPYTHDICLLIQDVTSM
jgi:hypothetical protein